jgi:YD repeat-containing protein
MKKLIRKILREQFEYKQQLFNLLKTGDSDNIEMVKMISQGQDINILELLIDYFKQDGPPYFKILNHFDLSDSEIDYILSGVFGEPVTSIVGGFNVTFRIYNKKDYEIYYEDSDGFWYEKKYDENGNLIYSINHMGVSVKSKYDDRGNLIYKEENSNSHWIKRKYDVNGNEIYYEDSFGDFKKWEYDEDGNIISFEDSRTGEKVYYT